MESDCSTTSECSLNDRKYIKELEKELKNCYLEIGYLQDQLGVHSMELNFMAEHVHCLELKVAGTGELHEKQSVLTEELLQSNAKCLMLTQEINSKDEDLRNYAMQIEELEASISSAALESQCEIESMRLDMIALEERCFEVGSLNQQVAKDKAEMHELLEKYEEHLHEAQDKIRYLDKENNELKVKLQGSERNFRRLHCKVEEYLSMWLNKSSQTSVSMHGEPYVNLSSSLEEKQSSLNEICTCGEVLCPLVSKLDMITAWDENVKNELEKMTNLIQESQLVVQKQKEELREEKSKAKEEAEDLTQAMAELRYEITGMLEEECKRRATIEHASLRRIQDLEEQVRKEQKKSLIATRLLQQVHKLFETQCCKEVQHLRMAFEGYHQITDLNTAPKIETCNCSSCDTPENSLDCLSRTRIEPDIIITDSSHSALLEWRADSCPPNEQYKWKRTNRNSSMYIQV